MDSPIIANTVSKEVLALPFAGLFAIIPFVKKQKAKKQTKQNKK